MRIEKRSEPLCGSLNMMLLTLGAIVAALAIGGLLFIPFGASPVESYGSLFGNAFFSLRGLGYTFVTATPVILTGLGTIVAWRCGFIFLGFEGCILLGAAGGTMIALQTLTGGMLDGAAALFVIPLSLVFGSLFGSIWCGVVGELKVRFGGNEVLMALMMNFIAIFLVQYLVNSQWRVEGDLPQTARIPKDYWLPFIIPGTRAHAGILIALAASGLIFFLMEKTRVGFEMIGSGLNLKAALYGGISVKERLRQSALAAGGLAGLAGAIEILGIHHRLLDGLSEGVGFIGIVAALLGRMTVPGTIVAAILYGGLSVGGDAMQRQTGLPSSIVLIIQATIVMLVIASDALRHYRISFSSRTAGLDEDLATTRPGKVR